MTIPEPFPRVTTPDETKPMFVTDLIQRIQSLLEQFGDLPVYVYDSRLQECIPMITGCVHQNFSGKTIVVSPTTETVNREMHYDLVMATRTGNGKTQSAAYYLTEAQP